MQIPRVYRFATALATTAVLFTGCDELSDNPTPAERADVIRTLVELGLAGNNGILRAGHQVRVSALVTDEFERPLPAVPLLWTTSLDGGSVAADSGFTGTDGILSGTWTAGTKAGMQEVVATVDGGTGISSRSPVMVYADTVVGSLELTAQGDSMLVGADALVLVTAAADQYGNPYALSGTQPNAAPPIEFATLTPDLITLTATTGRSALVRARAEGAARVVARSDGKADTVTIHVVGFH
jgi:hypothetical protein